MKTNRDDVVYDFARARLRRSREARSLKTYNVEVDRYKRAGAKMKVDDFVRYEKIKWSRDLKAGPAAREIRRVLRRKIRQCLYRPFCKRHFFLDRILNEEVYQVPRVFPTPETDGENRAIAATNIGSEKPFMVLVTDTVS